MAFVGSDSVALRPPATLDEPKSLTAAGDVDEDQAEPSRTVQHPPHRCTNVTRAGTPSGRRPSFFRRRQPPDAPVSCPELSIGGQPRHLESPRLRMQEEIENE